MGLNRVSNPKKLRQLGRAIGEPVVRAYARYFAGHALLVFGESGRQYALSNRNGQWHVEVYDTERFELVEHGMRIIAWRPS